MLWTPTSRNRIDPAQMKCLVINLDRSADRLAHIKGEFSRIGVGFERVAAIDAQERPDLASMPLKVKRISPRRLADAEIACLLSHRACWTIIAAGEDSCGAIFEDDVIFSGRAGALLADPSWIPADADIVKLETFLNRTTIARKRIAAGHGFSVSRLHATHIGSAGYILSRQAASDLIKATEDIGIPVDQLLFNPKFETSSSKTIYQMVPALCVQGQFLAGNAVRLPSLLKRDRDDQLATSGTDRKRKKSTITRVRLEIRRLTRQFADFCRLRQWKTIPFEHQGKRVRPPHTQPRETAL